MSDNEFNITNNNYPIIEQNTYQKICETITAMISIHQDDSNASSIQSLIGFSLLEQRSGRYYFGTPRPVPRIKREWKEAVKLANIVFRKNNLRSTSISNNKNN